MTAGLATAHANELLEIYRGTAVTGKTLYAQLHTADPGAAGTTAVSGVTTRKALTFAAASGGSMALASAPSVWNMTGTETLTHISLWDASTSGNFVRSIALASSKSVNSGDTFQLTVCTLAWSPLAA